VYLFLPSTSCEAFKGLDVLKLSDPETAQQYAMRFALCPMFYVPSAEGGFLPRLSKMPHRGAPLNASVFLFNRGQT